MGSDVLVGPAESASPDSALWLIRSRRVLPRRPRGLARAAGRCPLSRWRPTPLGTPHDLETPSADADHPSVLVRVPAADRAFRPIHPDKDSACAARRCHERCRFGRRLCRPWRRRSAFRQPNVRAVGFQRQKVGLHERFESQCAHRLLDSTQTLQLCGRQLHAGHFQIFGANPIQHALVEEDVHRGFTFAHAAVDLVASRNSRSAFSQSSTSWPSWRPRSQYSSKARRAMSPSPTSGANAGAVGDSTDGMVRTLSIRRLVDFGIVHLPDTAHGCRRFIRMETPRPC